ncbi:replicative DNA helicase [mine drainage metagenome]|uniref:Replicative DNA helicase n=1 Tax=mine drainage metagenome TaxID=410659 RepID=A0A1J5R1K3_9ZZZZ
MDEDTVTLAEQATLGSLLLEPAHLDDVRAWLRPGDFADWWHAQVYTAILERRATGEVIDVEALAQAMVDRLGERSGGRLRMPDLLRTTPGCPATTTYARMVVEAGLRREIAGQGVLLRAGALQSALSDGAGPLASACLMVDATMDSIAARWADANGSQKPVPSAPIPLRPVARSLELRTGADKFLADRPSRDHGAEREHIVTLIGSLLAHPDAIPGVATWLHPAQVSDPGWRAVYTAASDLAARGEPVDAVTVAWAVAPLRGRGTRVPSSQELREATDTGWLDHPVRAARIVAGEQVCALAERASAQISAAADDPTLEVGAVLDTAGLFTTALRRAATGLTRDAVTTRTVNSPDRSRGPVAG